MSAFSDTLSQFIDDKKIKVYSMAKYCDTDRSTMYKFISGKRNPPSDEIIKKWRSLCTSLRISLLQNSAAVLLLRILLMQKTGPTVFH